MNNQKDENIKHQRDEISQLLSDKKKLAKDFSIQKNFK